MSLKFPIAWRIRDCMDAASIKTVTDLYGRIKAIDSEIIRYAQLARLVADPPALLNLELLGILCVVLNCRPGDLLDPRAADISSDDKNI